MALAVGYDAHPGRNLARLGLCLLILGLSESIRLVCDRIMDLEAKTVEAPGMVVGAVVGSSSHWGGESGMEESHGPELRLAIAESVFGVVILA